MNTDAIKGFLMGVLTAVLLVAGLWSLLVVDSRNQLAAAPTSPTAVQAFGSGTSYVIPAAAFASDGFMPDSFFFSFSGGHLKGNASNYGCVKAPVYLPELAEISEMYASLYDNDPADSMSINLLRFDNFTGSSDVLGTINSSVSGAMNGIQILADTTITKSVVSYPDYSYYVTTCVDSPELGLYSIRLVHRSKIYLPYLAK